METVLKQPAELLTVEVSARGRVAELLSATSVARGLVPAAAPIGVTAALVGEAPSVRLIGGSDGERYLVTVRYRTDVGDELEDEVEVAVIDAAWSMPDGGAGYLSIVEFVERFGLAEAVAMTQRGDGRIDRAMLIGALRSAQGVADMHISARYDVPLTVIPEAVKGIVGDLARVRLYPSGVPDGVASLGRAAAQMLDRIASGALPLALPGQAEKAQSVTPILIRPGRRRLPNGLDDL